MTPAPAVELEGVRHRYPSRTEDAITIERLTILEGERVALIGHSGSGKTTLLRVINGLIRPLAGTVRVLETDLADPSARARAFRRRVGFVFQEFNLVERQSVYRNVLNGRLGWCGGPASLVGRFSETDRALAKAASAETGLESLARHRVDTLSGGQRQRLGLARALYRNPEVIVFDEATSGAYIQIGGDVLVLGEDELEDYETGIWGIHSCFRFCAKRVARTKSRLRLPRHLPPDPRSASSCTGLRSSPSL